MPEYNYLLDTRLTLSQKNTLQQVRDAAREAGMTVFLSGGAVRDLTTGSSVRDLDFTVQGNALSLEEALTSRGGQFWGRNEEARSLFFFFPGSIRIEVASARSERYPKPGQPEYSWTGIIDDLFRRDFTANAMAVSLNEGSYGLLLDPLNGAADIESRQLRLVSNYGFLEEPSRLIRAVRLMHRLGWQMEERTATRFESAREEDVFQSISSYQRGYELEKIAAEEEAYGVLQALEQGGWMEKLFPDWTSASADTAALADLRRNRIQMLMQGIAPDLTAVHMEVLTARMKAEVRSHLKSLLVRPGLVAQWDNLDSSAKDLARRLTSKDAAAPSATWKFMHNAPAEALLWLAHTTRGGAVESKFKNFFNVWPEAAKKAPVALMQEMRITPDLPNYAEILHEFFLRQIDGLLDTEEQIRAFLEPYSPPAPPPPVTLRRSRGKKGEKAKRKDVDLELDTDEEEDEEESGPSLRSDDDEDLEEEDDLDEAGEDALADSAAEDEEEVDEEEDVAEEPPAAPVNLAASPAKGGATAAPKKQARDASTVTSPSGAVRSPAKKSGPSASERIEEPKGKSAASKPAAAEASAPAHAKPSTKISSPARETPSSAKKVATGKTPAKKTVTPPPAAKKVETQAKTTGKVPAKKVPAKKGSSR